MAIAPFKSNKNFIIFSRSPPATGNLLILTPKAHEFIQPRLLCLCSFVTHVFFFLFTPDINFRLAVLILTSVICLTESIFVILIHHEYTSEICFQAFVLTLKNLRSVDLFTGNFQKIPLDLSVPAAPATQIISREGFGLCAFRPVFTDFRTIVFREPQTDRAFGNIGFHH